MAAFLAITLSFLIGSIPISWLIGKIKYNIDLRTFGDGNVGAGNLQRATGLKIGIFSDKKMLPYSVAKKRTENLKK